MNLYTRFVYKKIKKIDMKDLTIIIPAKNEHESLPVVLKSLIKFKCAITVSLKKDDLLTINAIKKFKVNIHKQSKIGYGNSLTEAIEKCKTKYFCIFNADGSFEAKDLYRMYKIVKKNDFVFASRYDRGGGSDDDSILTLVGNFFFTALAKIFFSLRINDILYTYIIGRTKSFKKIKVKNNDFRFCVELPIKMIFKNYKYTSFPSKEKKRIAGEKKVNEFKDGFLILLEMIRLFFIRK